jgi:hypothetical protein
MKSFANLIAFIILCTFSTRPLSAYGQIQIDSLRTDFTPAKYYAFNTTFPTPKRAGLYSALLPGLGQTYNRQYWKTGVVITGFTTLGFVLNYNTKQYRLYQSVYQSRIDNNPATSDTLFQYSTDDINTLRKGYRTYVEYTVLGITAFYAATVLDAFISAHLKSFDMSKDISFRMQPTWNNLQQPSIRCLITMNR